MHLLSDIIGQQNGGQTNMSNYHGKNQKHKVQPVILTLRHNIRQDPKLWT